MPWRGSKQELSLYASSKCRFGPGGASCPCCQPNMTSDQRKRALRRVQKQQLQIQLREEESNDGDDYTRVGVPPDTYTR